MLVFVQKYASVAWYMTKYKYSITFIYLSPSVDAFYD